MNQTKTNPTATFKRYSDDPTTMEQDLLRHSGQTVELIGEPEDVDPEEGIVMQHIRFVDGYEADAFVDELTQA